ncbi:MAG: T9SS type A sorting domain-containing protein [Flavobacteriales bacterium]|nr:T9SS type A sorting domain-containing protein [Flavobacteriales bacterium]
MLRTRTLLPVLALLTYNSARAAPGGGCPPGESELVVTIVPDAWPNEITWDVQTNGGTILASGTSVNDTTCVPTGTCLLFTMHDSYGDGIIGTGGYSVSLDGVTVASGGDLYNNNYTYTQVTEINCPPGFSCGNPLAIIEGSHIAPDADTWYSFTPALSGYYLITTCGLSTCDTRIYVYDHCTGLVFDDGPVGTMYFADGGCGLQAEMTPSLGAGQQVWIRIGGTGTDCDGQAIAWSLNYGGPIIGCTDPGSCNYNPLAAQDDGSCIPWGDPNCPQAPDLTVDQQGVQNSLNLNTVTVGQGDCYIAEGCLTGFGAREVIAFSTRIANIGDADYYIGTPGMNPDQFELQNCHGHTHYKGYAEYLLYDDQGQELAIGFKNGFCVMDIDCSGGGTWQYGCGNMGISAGCADVYGSGTSCNWLDITGVPEGTYTLVVRTNWDNDPDALGRVESNIYNNWAQVCIFIDRTPTLAITIDTTCEPYVDCLGEIYGSAQMDCEGNCGGTALIGDLDLNSQQNTSDVWEYVNGILGNDLTPMPCNDIDQDGNLTVTDAALMAYCDYWNTYNHPPDSNAVHDHCSFPFIEIINPFDSVTFTIGAVDLVNNTLDIHVKNPNRKILGYELLLSGLQITNVESLYDPIAYPAVPQFAFGTGHLMCLSAVDSLIERGPLYKPLCRVHFMNPEPLICIQEVIDVVNENYHNNLNYLENECVTSTGLSEVALDQGIRVFPNPFSEQTLVSYPPTSGGSVLLELVDLQGRAVLRIADAAGSGRFVIEAKDLAPGSYQYRLSGGVQGAGRLVLQR